jgi:hypothetical protein
LRWTIEQKISAWFSHLARTDRGTRVRSASDLASSSRTARLPPAGGPRSRIGVADRRAACRARRSLGAGQATTEGLAAKGSAAADSFDDGAGHARQAGLRAGEGASRTTCRAARSENDWPRSRSCAPQSVLPRRVRASAYHRSGARTVGRRASWRRAYSPESGNASEFASCFARRCYSASNASPRRCPHTRRREARL